MSTVSSGQERFQVTTTIRYKTGLLASQSFHDGVAEKNRTMSDFYLLAFHQDKILNAAKQSNWPAQLIELYSGDRGLTVLFARLLLHIHEDQRSKGPLQIHLALSKDGRLDLMSSPAFMPGLFFPADFSEKKDGPLISVLDALYKRSPIRVTIDDQITLSSPSPNSFTTYSSNFDEASTTHEKLLLSPYGDILKGEFTIPYFLQDDVWITPAFSGIALESVTRRYALEHGLCKEGVVLRSTLEHGDQCWLSDGVRGFFRGTISIPSQVSIPSSNQNAPGLHLRARESISGIHSDMGKSSGDDQKRTLDKDKKDTDDDEDDDDDLLMIPDPNPNSSPSAPASSLKRPNPFIDPDLHHTGPSTVFHSSPSQSSARPPTKTRRSHRGDPNFTPTILADEDDGKHSIPRDYTPVPTPEHGGSLHRRRPPRAYAMAWN